MLSLHVYLQMSKYEEVVESWDLCFSCWWHYESQPMGSDNMRTPFQWQMWPLIHTKHNITKIPMDGKLCVDEHTVSQFISRASQRHGLQTTSAVWFFANCIQFRTKKVVPWVMSNVEVQTNAKQCCNVWHMMTSSIYNLTRDRKSRCLPISLGNISVWKNMWQGHIILEKCSDRISC